ncbi:DUF397 domain-containing protein [Nocardiopsis sp. NPDC058789]|uniref:DUF397 domain-containing protein n=1 Tax=Nocardiopsis eucommiae TaxID=2831970 RepID=A0A975L7W0_9ACTN|nr:DUF397 domain-containing protein [Nocardiopsis eucommiae]
MVEWQKSSYSANGANCVEARATEEGAAVRDTQNRNLCHLEVSAAEWKAFVAAVRP